MQKYKINRSRHAAFLLHVHLVFVTKYRRKILGELHCAAFHQYAAEVCRDFGAELKESNGDVDHVHMLIEYPPTVQLSVLVNSLKAVTSRRLRNEFLDLRGHTEKPCSGRGHTLLAPAEVRRWKLLGNTFNISVADHPSGFSSPSKFPSRLMSAGVPFGS